MTRHLDYYCGMEFGCVEHLHTAHDCYWRYVDEACQVIYRDLPEGVWSYDQWLEGSRSGS